jgi:alpha-mannosidase
MIPAGMRFDKLVTIVPLSRIDPDAAELTERVAQATLGSYQALWHPCLLAQSAAIPVLALASDPPLPGPGQLILIPEPTRRFLPDSWDEQARAAGAKTIVGEETRARFLARLWEEFPEIGETAAHVDAGDFLALGLARLWLEMLTAYMKHTSTLDDDHLLKEVLAAAASAAVDDHPTRDDHLRAAFQVLMEARERIYGADVHLLDLCLLDPRAGLDRLGRQLKAGQPINIFASGRTAESLRDRDPAATAQLRAALDEGKAELVGGEFDEVNSTLLPLESHLWQFRRGDRSYQNVLGRTPTIFGRRRFGLARHVLQLLNRHEFLFLTHFCFDDGVFPVRAEPKVRLEAPDSTTVEALARIPLAADSALSFLKFPSVLARTMIADFVATVALVHWPMPESPWYDDLLRMTRYANVFARFSTLSHYFQSTDAAAISSSVSSDDYASPFLVHAHGHGSRQPISAFVQHHRARARVESVRWLDAVERVLRCQPGSDDDLLSERESRIEAGDADVSHGLDAAESSAISRFSSLICPRQAAAQPGVLVLNTLAIDRRVELQHDISGRVHDVSSRVTGGADSERRWFSANVPAMGFAWISLEAAPPAGEPDRNAVTVDELTIRNEKIEVEIDETTGGIRSLRDLVSRVPQLGQQLVLVGIPPSPSYSYDPTPGTDSLAAGGYGAEPSKVEMRATGITTRSAGPDVAEIVAEGELVAKPCPTWANSSTLARFRQTYRLGRGQSILRVFVEILDLVSSAIDPRASPWQSYIASRFAWPDSRSVLMRAVGQVAEPSRSQRPESPYFVEIHGRRHRAAIITGGLPFHQRIGQRMLDTLLVTATESSRSFEFAVGVDLPNPFQAALDLITPAVMIPCDGPPTSGPAGWFFHVDVQNIVITSLAPLGPSRCGVRMRLFESAGRYTRARLRCPRNVGEARMTDFRGQRLSTLEAEADTLSLDLSPHEITQIEIEFAQL